MEETTITNPTYDSHYRYGGFNLYKGGLYVLHPQHTSIGTIPDENYRGRVNKGCIGVCGKGSAGWGGVTDMLFAAAGMDEQVKMKQDQRKNYLEQMLTKINLTIKIDAFSIPSGTPTAINKGK